MVTSQLPWPSWMLAPASWPELRALLSRSLDLASRGDLPATLMLVGDAGLGREALAIELAAGLVVHGGPPAGCTCPSCDRARRGVHPDVEVIVPEEEKVDISIDQARAIIGGLDRRPYEGFRRVIVFSSCQIPPLGQDAAAALLKGLEEPPPAVSFLLLAANPEQVLPTIRSRSVQLRVPAPTPEQAVVAVAAACGIDLAAAHALIERCHGQAELLVTCGDAGLGDAAAALDRLLVAAISGDGAAMLKAAGLVKTTPHGMALAVASMLRAASSSPAEQAERLLAAAAALLSGERRRARLRLDADTTVLAALSPYAAGVL